MANTIKILNNEARVHTIGYGYARTAGGAGKKAMTIRLLPGLNEVNAQAWEEAKKLKVVAWHVKKGNFQEVVTKAAGLRGMSSDDAIDLIGKTLDRELLRKWKSEETREAVITALELQIDEVSFDPDRDSAKTDEGFDLKPEQASTSMDGAMVANQVQKEDTGPVENLEPVKADPPDRGSKAPPEPPAELSRQLRDVPKHEPKHHEKHEKHPAKHGHHPKKK